MAFKPVDQATLSHQRSAMAYELRTMADQVDAGQDIPTAVMVFVFYKSSPTVHCQRLTSGSDPFHMVGTLEAAKMQIIGSSVAAKPL